MSSIPFALLPSSAWHQTHSFGLHSLVQVKFGTLCGFVVNLPALPCNDLAGCSASKPGQRLGAKVWTSTLLVVWLKANADDVPNLLHVGACPGWEASGCPWCPLEALDGTKGM